MDTPTFVGQIDNVTAIIGEDIVLKCKVKNLRSRRVTKEDPAFHRGILSVVQGGRRTTAILTPPLSLAWVDGSGSYYRWSK